MPLICPICRSGLDQAGSDADCVALPCGHVFHHDCALPWLEQQSSCAQCRRTISNQAKDVTKIFFAASDCTENDELVYLRDRLDKVEREKEAAKEEIRQANRSIVELKDSSKDTESHADAMLNDLVAHQQELNQAKARLRESQRERKELAMRLSEAEQLADRYQRKLNRLKTNQPKSDKTWRTSVPEVAKLFSSEPTDTNDSPAPVPLQRKNPVPRPRSHRPISTLSDSSATSVETPSILRETTEPEAAELHQGAEEEVQKSTDNPCTIVDPTPAEHSLGLVFEETI